MSAYWLRLVVPLLLAGGLMYAESPQVSVALALGSATGKRVLAHLTVATTSKVTLEFSSGQELDAAVVNSEGKEVHRWSTGKMFAQVLHKLDVAPEKQWVVDMSPAPALPPGKYVLQVWLTLMGQPKSYTASIPIEVTP